MGAARATGGGGWPPSAAFYCLHWPPRPLPLAPRHFIELNFQSNKWPAQDLNLPLCRAAACRFDARRRRTTKRQSGSAAAETARGRQTISQLANRLRRRRSAIVEVYAAALHPAGRGSSSRRRRDSPLWAGEATEKMRTQRALCLGNLLRSLPPVARLLAWRESRRRRTRNKLMYLRAQGSRLRAQGSGLGAQGSGLSALRDSLADLSAAEESGHQVGSGNKNERHYQLVSRPDSHLSSNGPSLCLDSSR